MVKRFLVEDHLDRASNYGSLKPRVLLYLEENEVRDFSLTTMPVPDDATQLAVWKRNDGKARRILMDEPSTKKLRRRLPRMMIQLSGQIDEHQMDTFSLT